MRVRWGAVVAVVLGLAGTASADFEIIVHPMSAHYALPYLAEHPRIRLYYDAETGYIKALFRGDPKIFHFHDVSSHLVEPYPHRHESYNYRGPRLLASTEAPYRGPMFQGAQENLTLLEMRHGEWLRVLDAKNMHVVTDASMVPPRPDNANHPWARRYGSVEVNAIAFVEEGDAEFHRHFLTKEADPYVDPSRHGYRRLTIAEALERARRNARMAEPLLRVQELRADSRARSRPNLLGARLPKGFGGGALVGGGIGLGIGEVALGAWRGGLPGAVKATGGAVVGTAVFSGAAYLVPAVANPWVAVPLLVLGAADLIDRARSGSETGLLEHSWILISEWLHPTIYPALPGPQDLRHYYD